MIRRFAVIFLLLPALYSQAVPVPSLSPGQMEEFLLKAKEKNRHGAKKGITGTTRLTMTDGTLTHDASIQTIDEKKAKFETPMGTEFNFQDSFKLNIAAYRLGKLLGVESMIPMSVQRSFDGKPASYTWWIENFQIDEVDRLKKKIEAPDKDRWSRQYLIMKVFDQLIYNMDRNATNMLYDKDWKLWMIDHSRSFRLHAALQNKKALEKCDSVLLARLKALKESDVKEQTGKWLEPAQIRALMARRKLIVDYFEAAGPTKLYDYLPAP